MDAEEIAWDEMFNHKILSREEEQALLRSWHLARQEKQKPAPDAGIVATGKAARERLVACNLKMVLTLASRHRGHLEIQDAFSEGVTGLLTAINKYDCERFSANKFSTYAGTWIIQVINRRRCDTDFSEGYRKSVHYHLMTSRKQAAEQAFYREHGRKPTHEELLALTGMSPLQLRNLTERKPAKSLDQPTHAHEEGDGIALGEIVPSPGLLPDEAADYAELRQAIQEILGELPVRSRRLLEMHFGLKHGGEGMMYVRIAEQLHMTRERVRQIIALELLPKLRQNSRLRELAEAWLVIEEAA
jgi:RNA polymerase sigma factor (sigma-70 family)